MKRIISCLIIAILALSLFSCASGNGYKEKDGVTYIELNVYDDRLEFNLPISAFIESADLTAEQISKEKKAAKEEELDYTAFVRVLYYQVGDIVKGNVKISDLISGDYSMSVSLDEEFVSVEIEASEEEISELMYDYKSSDEISGFVSARIFHGVDKDLYSAKGIMGTASDVSIGNDKDCRFTVKDNRTK